MKIDEDTAEQQPAAMKMEVLTRNQFQAAHYDLAGTTKVTGKQSSNENSKDFQWSDSTNGRFAIIVTLKNLFFNEWLIVLNFCINLQIWFSISIKP